MKGSLNKDMKRYHLSTRSAIFSACIIASASVSAGSGTDVKSSIISFASWFVIAAVCIIVWTVTLRFIENPETFPASVALNLLPAVIGIIFLKDQVPSGSLSLISGGLTALSAVPSDLQAPKDNPGIKFTGIDFLNGDFVKSEEFNRADVKKEILIPAAVSVICCIPAVLLSGLLARVQGAQVSGFVLMVGSLMLMLLPFLSSRISKTDFIMSSDFFSGTERLPSVKKKSLRSFCLRRIRFFICIVLICSGCLLSDYLNGETGLDLPFMKYVLSLLLVFIFAFVRGRHTHHRISFAVELCLVYSLSVQRCRSVHELIVLCLCATFADILINGLIYTHERRLINSHRSRFVAGMPLELMSIAVILTVLQIFFHYFGFVIQ